MTMRSLLLAAACLLALAAPASADLFANPTRLPNGDPKAHPFYGGGEPSIAFDPSGDGHVYVTAPQGIPTALGSAAGVSDSAQGVAFWGSGDHGASFPTVRITGAGNGGGDSDVEALGDHTVLVADLEAAAADICTSHDFGNTFQDCNGGLSTNQQGPENDHEWLTRGTQPGEVYLTYHDFAGGFPIIEKSTDGGKSFSPCGTIIDPGGPAAQNYTPAGGTLVSKPVVAPDGSIFVEFTTPDQSAPPVGAKLNHLYMAVAKGDCDSTTVFTDHLIYENPGASLASIFQQTARDGGGELYVLAAGQTDSTQSDSGLFLFTSTDDGATWSKPIQVTAPGSKASVFPTIAGGKAKGEALLGWFGTPTSGDPNDGKDQWDFFSAATYDGGATFATSKVTSSPIHYGDICTQGTFCGAVPGQPGNRNLADFASAAVDPADGCGIFAIPGDPYNRPDLPNGDNNGTSSAYVSRQTDRGACFTAANSGKAASAAVANVSGSGNGCIDRVAPSSRFSKRVRVARHRRGVTLTGRSRDRGCGPHGAGKVSRVRVAIARKQGTRCRFARANGRFGRLVSCLRTSYLSARGTWRFRFTYRHHLPKGKYLAWARGIDKAGNVERKARMSNAKHFTVR
ncbi:MAG: hypothetical protein ACXVFT_05205 [Solirubrobacteraceae bacterium]